MPKRHGTLARPKDLSSDHARIRAVFLDRRDTYSTPAAALLTGLDRADLLDRIRTGEIDSVPRVTHRIPWDDVALLLMERVPLATIYDALGDHADEVLPSLLRLEPLDVRLPVYAIRMLEWIAKLDGVTVEQYLHRELFDLLETLWRTHPEVDETPGVAEALFFPDLPPRRRDR
jgi:hypothetical protein